MAHCCSYFLAPPRRFRSQIESQKKSQKLPQLQLTDVAIRSLKGSQGYVTYYDTKLPAFGVRVGKRSKTFVVMRGRVRERVTIGRYPQISLAEARAKAKKLLAADPEPKMRRISFASARDEFITAKCAELKSSWPENIRAVLGKHFKAIEGKKLADVTDRDIQRVFETIEGPSARLHAFRVIRAFFNWSLKPPRRYLTFSPVAGYDPPGRDRRRTRVLSDEELKAVWNACGTGSRPIFRLMILWGTRSTETTLIRHDWVRDEVLTIPGFQNGRRITKSGRDHGIPLLPVAKQILEERPPLELYFPGQKSWDIPINSDSLFRMRREIQEETGTSGWGAHDLRRTFRSNMARFGVERDLCERLINHAPAVLDEIYDRYDRLKEKRRALARYEAFLLKLLGSGTT
jgi:integrase